MRIRMTTAMAGTRDGEPWPEPGVVVETLPTHVAAHLVASGVAEEVPDDEQPAATPSRRKGARGADGSHP